ncbi:MAG: AraC family transcriptional regulator [Clostridia bacterium]|nr:AraC family transcriptional regulator [Clostridia bacterium]
MRNTSVKSTDLFAVPPVSIVMDELAEGARKQTYRMDAVYRPIARTMLKSVTDILGTEYVFSGYHYHEGIEIFRIRSGSAKVVVNNRPMSVEKDDVLIVNAFEAHGTYLADAGVEFSRSCVMFHPYHIFPAESGNDRFFADLKSVCFENKIPASHPASPALRESVDRITSLFEAQPNGWTVAVFAEVMRIYSTAVSAGLCRAQTGNTSYMFDFMTRVSAYIEDHLDEDISTTDIAAHCQYSTEHFCRLFKKCFDKTFKDYLNIYRIQKSKDFIDMGNFNTIAEIASKCGFNNQNHFGHMFKKYVGVLPSEYINHQRKEP